MPAEEIDDVLFSFFLVCFVQLAIATVLLVALGRRVRWPRGRSRVAPAVVSLLLAVAVTVASGAVASSIWALPSGPVEAAEVFLLLVAAAVVALRPDWNAIGQLFFASYVGAALAYLSFAAWVTVAAGLSFVASVASAVLFLLELMALLLSSSFAFETCDVLCRTRHTRVFPQADGDYLPMVSLHIAAYNEPPDMLIKTIKAAENLDYPNFEVVVIDNNTEDQAVWGPVEEYCRERERLRFVHVAPLDGYKSGALNLALDSNTDPKAEIVGVIDADYLVEPDYLRETVGYFADGRVAFVQTPQDYRDYEGSGYFTACYDAYRYFFAMAMPSRNERDSIIFAGTMGLLRRNAMQAVGGWDEWTITEDADLSLRLLRSGWSGLYISRSFGQGIMPLTFASLKSQRFRWCFGGMQILRRHWRSLMPWDRSEDNHLSIAQRLDYLIGGMQWLNDLVYLGFTIVLLVVSGLLIAGEHVAVRPLVGPALLLPAALLASGLLRAVWALRQRTHISYRRAFLAFANWLSLSFTVALACIQGLVRSEGVFLRTPKTSEHHRLRAAFWAARSETAIAALLVAAAVLLGVMAHPTLLLLALVTWQALVYVSSPYMSWLNQRAQLTPELETRRRTEERRERFARVMRPVYVGTAAAALMGVAFVALFALGASNPGRPSNPFQLPPAAPATTVPPASTTTTTSPSKSKSTTTTSPASSTSTTSPSTSTTTSTTTTTPSTSTTTTTTVPASTTTTSTVPPST